MVEVLAESSERYPARAPLELWDFSFAEGPLVEAAPNGPSERMQWYWDSAHFRTELGALVLSRLFEAADAPQNFGAKLTRENFETHRQRWRQLQESWSRTNQSAEAELATVESISRDATGHIACNVLLSQGG
jgi:hypothetical protein